MAISTVAICRASISPSFPRSTRKKCAKSRKFRSTAYAYPVYDIDYQRHFETVDNWLSSLDGFLSFGRQGLFAHDNTHHAFAMAYAAAEVLTPEGGIDRAKWAAHRHEFESHRVED